jgi:DNA helicase-2/ATP-dependent DNA helicase PcrA
VRGGAELMSRPEVRACLDVLRQGERLLAGALPDLKALAADMEADRSEDAETVANVDLVVRCAHDHLRLDPAASSMGFLGWLVATLEAEGNEAGRDAVTLATFHAAKGLEWPVVHLAGVEDGFVPISHARTREARAEEARLLYVAMTRAEDELRCTWAAARDFGGKLVDRRLSPWLGGLSEAQRARPAAGPGGPPDDWRLHLAAQRRELALATASIAAREAPTGALAALHAWRDEAARAARVDPRTLLDDRLLEAIVERRPTSTDELAEVPGMGRLLAARLSEGLLAALAAGDPATAGA